MERCFKGVALFGESGSDFSNVIHLVVSIIDIAMKVQPTIKKKFLKKNILIKLDVFFMLIGFEKIQKRWSHLG